MQCRAAGFLTEVFLIMFSDWVQAAANDDLCPAALTLPLIAYPEFVRLPVLWRGRAGNSSGSDRHAFNEALTITLGAIEALAWNTDRLHHAAAFHLPKLMIAPCCDSGKPGFTGLPKSRWNGGFCRRVGKRAEIRSNAFQHPPTSGLESLVPQAFAPNPGYIRDLPHAIEIIEPRWKTLARSIWRWKWLPTPWFR